jgi:AraC family transcriptional regulator
MSKVPVPITQHRHRSWGGLAAGIFSVPAGVIEAPPSPHHVVTMHLGGPVRAVCRVDGLQSERVQENGDVDVIPAGLPSFWKDETPATFLALILSPALLKEAAGEMGLDPDRAELSPQFQLREAPMQHIAWAVKAELESGEPSDRLYGESLGLALATYLLRHHAPTDAWLGRHGLSRRQRRDVLDYIDSHLDSRLTLAELSEIAGLGISRFKVLFKQAFGLPVHRYVIRRRVEHATRLLQRGDMSITQVALVTGFAHPSHLARWMRRVIGVTPSDVLRSRR